MREGEREETGGERRKRVEGRGREGKGGRGGREGGEEGGEEVGGGCGEGGWGKR